MKVRPLLLFLAFVILPSTFVMAAELSTTPILRIEAGMHTAPIRRISTDVTGTRVITCSSDKTAKLWALSPGQPATLLRTFRIPIGDGNEGKLYACALRSDGNFVALGGVCY